ncbi:condensation domain-containing protein [Rhizobium sp. 007]|uniref:condensation domain-containing protein n=1 Tax=Rhizobium sp. 007 TaxID=2785056 RepID=UPI0024856EF0|nr:condensation domain-containing protein [Rhizobium sp. 007]
MRRRDALAVRPGARAADPRPADPAGGGRTRLPADPASYRLRRLVDGRAGAELSQLYRAFEAGEDDPLPPLAIQYPDYAAWQRQWLSGERLQSQAQYWRNALANAPARLALPTDRARPAQQSFAGASVPVVIDQD